MVTENLKLAVVWNFYPNTNMRPNLFSSQPKQTGFAVGKFPTKVGLHGEWWNTGPARK